MRVFLRIRSSINGGVREPFAWDKQREQMRMSLLFSLVNDSEYRKKKKYNIK